MCGGDPVVIERTVTIEGSNPLTRIGCPFPGHHLLLFNISAAESENATETVATFAGVHLTGCVVYATNAGVRFRRSRVDDTRIKVFLLPVASLPAAAAAAGELVAEDSEFVGTVDDDCAVNCGTSTALDIRGSVVGLRLANSTFLHTSVVVHAQRALTVSVVGCSFDAVGGSKRRFLGGLLFNVDYDHQPQPQPSTIVVRGTTFENLLHNDPVLSVMNIVDAALLVRVNDLKSRRVTTGASCDVTVDVDGCRFGRGERGMTLVGPISYVRVANSVFDGNVAMHAGAGILFLTRPYAAADVVNCTFRNNAGGAFRSEQLTDHLHSFQVSNVDLFN